MADILRHSTNSDGEVDERVIAKAALESAEEQLRSLCAQHAGTFVSVERRGTSLEQALENLLEKCKLVENQVQNAQLSLEQEEDSETSLAALSEKHRVRRRTLLQHSSLLELLELPSLMDACVRSNLYEEALSIAAFANTLERRHTEKNEVVLKVILQVRSRQSDLRRHLLHCLKNQVTMPQCLEIVTALRRLNSIDLERQAERDLERTHAAMEWSLQVDFLEARDAWLDQPANSPTPAGGTPFGRRNTKVTVHSSEQLLDTIERYRTRMFGIATQFNAIFRAQGSAQKISVSLLAMWTTRRVHSFMIMLESSLRPVEDSASLRDALDACVFFSASMGRLGADFTAQLPSLFENKMHDLVVQKWKEGTLQLADTLKICREACVASPLSSTIVAAATSEASDSESTGPLPPPRQLMTLPPMGRWVNAVLSGLNDLRRCLLPGIFERLRESLQAEIQETMIILQSNERAVMTPGLRGDAVELRLVAKEMREVMTSIVESYVRGALEASLGCNEAAEAFFQKMEIPSEEPENEEQEEVDGSGEEENVDEDADEGGGDVDSDGARGGAPLEPSDGTEFAHHATSTSTPAVVDDEIAATSTGVDGAAPGGGAESDGPGWQDDALGDIY